MDSLRVEEEIISSWDRESIIPIVTICCTTFNHKEYIEDALNGFLNQKTSFPYEIIIHDDASTDGTADIVRSYQSRYPRIIRAIFQQENQYSKGVSISPTFVFPIAKGQYIAMCEGDDYWVDQDKIQKQKDFMDDNIDFSFCCHSVYQIDNTKVKSPYNAYVQCTKKILNTKDVILNHFIPTLSLFFRREAILGFLDGFNGTFTSGDVFLSVILSTQGLGYFDNCEMGVYRHHDGGVTKLNDDTDKIFKSIYSYKNLYSTLLGFIPKNEEKNIKIAMFFKTDYALLRIRIKQGFYLKAVTVLFLMFRKLPFWPLFLFKKKMNGGFLE